MRALIFVVYFLLAVAGCDIVPANSIITRSDVNGETVLHSVVTRAKDGTESFSCRTSNSGQCHYVVFVERCPSGKTTVCAPDIVSTFSVAAGKTRGIAGLANGFKVCVKTDAPPDAATCAGA